MSEPSRKKKRTSLVCLSCRRKKIRCDRGQPCDQCTKMDKASICTYDEDALKVNSQPNKQAPYLSSVNRPMRLTGPKPSGNVHNNSTNHGYRSASQPAQEVVTVDSAESELNLLKKRLQMIENSLRQKEQNSQADSKSPAFKYAQPPPPPGYTNGDNGYEKDPNATVFIDKSSHFFKPKVPAAQSLPPNNYRPPYSGFPINGGDQTPKQTPLPPVFNSRSNSAFLDYAKKPSSARNSISRAAGFPGATGATPDFPSDPYFSTWTKMDGLSPIIPPLTPGAGFPATPSFLQPGNTPKLTDGYHSMPNPLPSVNSPFSSDPTASEKHRTDSSTMYGSTDGLNQPTESSATTTNPSSMSSGHPTDGTPQAPSSKFPSAGLTPAKLLCGVNPYSSPEDTINFYEGYSPVYIKESERRISFGPFTWSSLMQKDPALRILWDHAIQTKETMAKTALIFTNKDITAEMTSVLTSKTDDDSINLDEKVFEKRLLQPEGVGDLVPYYKLMKNKVEKKLEQVQNDMNTLPLGLTYYDGKIEAELRLIDKIQLFLPKQKVIWKLIHIFFMDLYPFMPFTDEVLFRKQIAAIIGPEDYKDEKIAEIKIEKRLDLAYMGTLLIFLRLSYLSLFTNRNEVNVLRLHKGDDPEMSNKAYKYLLSNPITINIIDIAQECLDQFDLFRQPSFPVLQLASFTKLYHSYAPEDGDGADGGDSSGMLALLIQMAISLGCNREPDNLPNLKEQGSLNNAARRIWHYLVLTDLHLCYTFGNPINIARGSYDTKVPFYREGEECLQDRELDKFITETLYSNAILYPPVRNILHMALNIEGRSKVSELCKAISELELLLASEYGTLNNCLNPPPFKYKDITRTLMTKFYLSVKTFCTSLFSFLFAHYEFIDRDMSFFYVKKIMLINVGEIMVHYFDLIGNLKYDLILNPTIEQTIHKSNHVMLSLVIRCNFSIYHLRQQPDHETRCAQDTDYLKYFRALCQFSSSLTRCLEVSVAVISKISNRYYYAWRITKGHTYLLKTVTKKEFYDSNYSKVSKLRVCSFSLSQLEELIDICENTLNRLGKENSGFMFSPDLLDDATKSKTPKQDDPMLNLKPMSPFQTTDKPTGTGEHNGDETVGGGFDLDFVDSAEIDKIWLQMLSSKEKPDDKEGEPNMNELTGNFDFFSNVPLSEMFDLSKTK